jgi:serine/threonine-protein kinase RsbW
MNQTAPDQEVGLEIMQERSIRHCLQAQSSLLELSDILTWFNQAYAAQLPRPLLIQCQTILAEGFTNAVRHAHCHLSSDTPIELEVELLADQIEICIWDQGPEFDLTQRLANLEKAGQDAIGGRGIQLITRLADSFTYQRIEQRNCLHVVKTYSS